MNRARFLILSVGCTALVAVVAASGACGGPSQNNPNSVDSGSDAPLADGDIDALGKWCMDQELAALEEWAKNPSGPLPATMDHDISADLVIAARKAWVAGDTVIPLSPSTCTRLVVKRDGGKVVSETIIRAPFKPTIDQKTYKVHYVPASIGRFTYTDKGESFRGDYDGDGFDEERAEVTYGVGAVREHHAPSNDAITSRYSGTVVDNGGLLELVDETLIGGVLTKTRKERVSFLQSTCETPQKKPPPKSPNPGPWKSPDVHGCSAAQGDQIAKLISTALATGTKCLFAAGMEAQSDRVLKTFVRANEVKLDCVDKFTNKDDEFLAANDRGYMNVFPGDLRLIVYTPLLGASEPLQVGTIGHELFHLFDGHDADLEASATEDQLRMSDQVYACEYLCFGSKPTECHLAACQKKKVSTSWNGKSCQGTVSKADISKIEKARNDGVTIEPCDTGHQVGAVCHDVKGAGTQVQFCSTLVECNAACGSPCESKSLSCLDSCR